MSTSDANGTRARRARSQRGVTLIEAMISLTLLMVGILGMMRLQIYGITSDQGARANGIAQDLAVELAAGLLRLDPSVDSVLAPHVVSATPPAGFGNPLDSSGELATDNWRAWSDAYLTGTTAAIPRLKVVGVRPDSALERDPIDPAQPMYKRRWSVWQVQTSNQTSGVRLMAVSVVYRERSLPRLKTVTRYVQIPNLGASTVNVSAFR